MSFQTYKASNAIQAAMADEQFKQTYKHTIKPLMGKPGCITNYTSTQSILESLEVDEGSSDAFSFIANHETGEEEVFEVHSVLSEVKLPPVLKNSRVHVNDLIQTVKIISIDGDEEFRKACIAIAHFVDLLQQSTVTTTKVPYGIKQETASELVFVN
ncbi:uncharacterized protein ARMOST_07017 [Armillaria ostoyae]|uniref:Uncharacterized protein n=1 Tax=Armillaria ostoyae TaxID=47428 RepID=A0A284R4M7_ARMOS|nr:uncharacterized protein ARMOST_07017 [Armillaria ostoyae]